MKCVQLVERRKLELTEIPAAPEPGPGEVMVRVRAVGICGSDLHWYLDGQIGHTRMRFPHILGHEPSGEIVAVGPGVADRQPGQTVAIEPAISCGHCDFCHAARYNLCAHVRFLSSPPHPGLFREYVTLPAKNVLPVPASLGHARTTLIEPLAVIMHVMEMAPVRLGETVAVLGAGPIGLLTAQAARLAGAGKVIAADKVAHRARLAQTLGADAAVCTREAKLVESLRDLAGPHGVDIVYDAASAAETMNAALEVLRPGGRLVLIGLPYEEWPKLDLYQALNKEIVIHTVRRSNHNDLAALDLLERGRISDAMVSHRFPLAQTAEAFRLLEDYSDGVAKVVIEL